MGNLNITQPNTHKNVHCSRLRWPVAVVRKFFGCHLESFSDAIW
jgi:hypothetical protein